MINWLRKQFINILVKNLYRGVRAKDILRTDKKGNITFRGKPLDHDARHKIAREASLIQNTTVWRLLQEEMQYLAERDIIVSKSSHDEFFGKAQLYILTVIAEKIDNLSKL